MVTTSLAFDFATYGTLTAERILARFGIHLEQATLSTAVNNPHSLYYELLRVPFKNTLNGIVYQQAYDYQVYAQKLFIDYLLSGKANKEDSAAGMNQSEEALEEARQQLMTMGEALNEQELVHYRLISESQARLISFATGLQRALSEAATRMQVLVGNAASSEPLARVLEHLLASDKPTAEGQFLASPDCVVTLAKALQITVDPALKVALAAVLNELNDYREQLTSLVTTFLTQAVQLNEVLCSYRRQFADFILTVQELVRQLPDYSPDEKRDAINRALLYFDSDIGL